MEGQRSCLRKLDFVKISSPAQISQLTTGKVPEEFLWNMTSWLQNLRGREMCKNSQGIVRKSWQGLGLVAAAYSGSFPLSWPRQLKQWDVRTVGGMSLEQTSRRDTQVPAKLVYDKGIFTKKIKKDLVLLYSPGWLQTSQKCILRSKIRQPL